MKTFRNLVCLSLIAAVACSAVADETEKKGKGKRGERKKPTATQRFVGKLELSDEQKTQVAAIDKQFAEKFTTNQKALNEILTADQKKAQQAAQKAAKEAGTKGGEARKEIEAALDLSDEQKAKRKSVQADQKKLDTEVIAALKKVLTEEQQEKLPKTRPTGAKGEKGKKKKEAA